MNVKLDAGQLKAIIDAIASWAYWLAALGVLVLFVGAVAAAHGITSRYLPTMSPTTLVYLAGIAWLIKR